MNKKMIQITYLKTSEAKESRNLNNSLTRPKTNNSSNKAIIQKKISNSLNEGSSNNNSFSNINNPPSKRSYSISETNQSKVEEKKIKQNNNNTTTVISNKNGKVNISPNIVKSRKIANIPVAKNKKLYNSNTYEGNFKKEAKTAIDNILGLSKEEEK